MRIRILTLALAASSLLVLSGCAGSGDASSSPTTPPASSPAAADGCGYVAGGGAAREVTPPPAEPTVTGELTAVVETSAGAIPMTLDAEGVPCTVGSFVSLAEQSYFTDTPCHRLTTSGIFVLQCGDPSGTGRGGPGYSYPDELDGTETYPAGTVAMANAGPDTNGSQFFLVYEDSELPPSYTVFGQLAPEGLEVVRTIAAAGAEGGQPDGAPATPVTITGVTVG
ncbi:MULTISPECIES: peptidylprolyl isomerase [Microbacterium]|uniref:Peptidyl-prolyl cis-trans isomerase n=1 Tax=Microbacterium wangchenii TaxID=2541726 RepID=A0ABX5SMC8_9MICO|nr:MULTISPECIES: peptidylprolyl isomerase [Microbacterium]MCK6066298.1 peptidylprolyl isomerase [Microbacterium sp. EYE_512]QBR87273.1 peptidylprolyl isomerase [Microbacterium wangchenii]